MKSLNKLKFTAIFAAIIFIMAAILISQNPKGYIVREYNGKIGVFARGSNVLQETLNVRVSDLPILDRERLYSGIIAQNDEQLYKIIEDFDG